MIFAKNFARNYEKKIMLGTSDARSMSCLSHRPSVLYGRLLDFELHNVYRFYKNYCSKSIICFFNKGTQTRDLCIMTLSLWKVTWAAWGATSHRFFSQKTNSTHFQTVRQTLHTCRMEITNFLKIVRWVNFEMFFWRL